MTKLYHWCVLFLSITSSAVDQWDCVNKYENQKLENHLIREFERKSELLCYKTCVVFTKCASYNWNASSHLCELSDATDSEYPDDLVAVFGFRYGQPTAECNKNSHPCASKPCIGYDVCVSVTEGSSYVCLQKDYDESNDVTSSSVQPGETAAGDISSHTVLFEDTASMTGSPASLTTSASLQTDSSSIGSTASLWSSTTEPGNTEQTTRLGISSSETSVSTSSENSDTNQHMESTLSETQTTEAVSPSPVVDSVIISALISSSATASRPFLTSTTSIGLELVTSTLATSSVIVSTTPSGQPAPVRVGNIPYDFYGCIDVDDVAQVDTAVTNDNSMTHAKCAGECEDYNLFALQKARSCFCGEEVDFSKFERRTNDECNHQACKGDDAPYCGDNVYMAVFHVSNTSD